MYKFEGQKSNYFIYVDGPCGDVYGPYDEEQEPWQQGGTKYSFETEPEAWKFKREMKDYFNSI